MAKAYQGKEKIAWMEIYAGGRSVEVYGENTWLPDETFDLLENIMLRLKAL